RIQREAGITSLYVTHDQAEAMAMSDRIAVMESGRVRQVGTPEEIYHRPATVFVARFIGRSNVLSMPVVSAGPTSVEVQLPGGGTATIAAPADHGLRPSDVALVSLRPEHVGLSSPDDGDAVAGRVTDVEFTGMVTSLTVDVSGQPMMVSAVEVPGRPAVGDR